uniref:Protein NATD1 n=1 Tax=Piliocolobus tephrosceles TaxID=591936 RepID=A0A8C9I7R1_9PRIM
MAHSAAAVPLGALEQSCPIRVEHDRRRRQFTVRLNGCHDRAVLLYEYVGKRIVDLQHTEVPDAYRGRGIAKHLAKAALDFVVEEDLKAHLTCWYIQKSGRHRHPALEPPAHPVWCYPVCLAAQPHPSHRVTWESLGPWQGVDPAGPRTAPFLILQAPQQVSEERFHKRRGLTCSAVPTRSPLPQQPAGQPCP